MVAAYEAEAVNETIQCHQTEHEEYPLAESLAIMQIMDRVRQQIGLVYEVDADNYSAQQRPSVLPSTTNRPIHESRSES